MSEKMLVNPTALMHCIPAGQMNTIERNLRHAIGMDRKQFDEQLLWRYNVSNDNLADRAAVMPFMEVYVSEWATIEMLRETDPDCRVEHLPCTHLIPSGPRSMNAIVRVHYNAFPDIHSFGFMENRGILTVIALPNFEPPVTNVVTSPIIDVNCWSFEQPEANTVTVGNA